VALIRVSAAEAIADLGRFDALIDARSPAEFAEDRLPGAVNWPSLDDDERAAIGTEYKQVSAFEAKKRGAALVARNVAGHVERHVLDKPREWTPLVYCWRGGKRSGALATVLEQIGFRVHLLEGGYRDFRRAVVAALETMPERLSWRVVCGPTGSGKSRLLDALAAEGAQVLDLERLANHRGSVLGLVPGSVQPSQKAFDTQLWDALRRLDPSRPVFVESESKKIGDLRVPESLIRRMRASPCLWLELPLDARVELLMTDYDFFVADVDAFCARLDALRALRGNAVVEAWQEAARAGRAAEVVRDLLVAHYDPFYLESMRRNFTGLGSPTATLQWDGRAASLREAARAAIEA
jgi:tRNA 2-selenouridine synthase